MREMFYLLYNDYNHSPNQPLQTKTQPCCDILLPCNTHPFLCHVIFNSLVYLFISSMFGSLYNNVIISTAALSFFLVFTSFTTTINSFTFLHRRVTRNKWNTKVLWLLHHDWVAFKRCRLLNVNRNRYSECKPETVFLISTGKSTLNVNTNCSLFLIFCFVLFCFTASNRPENFSSPLNWVPLPFTNWNREKMYVHFLGFWRWWWHVVSTENGLNTNTFYLENHQLKCSLNLWIPRKVLFIIFTVCSRTITCIYASFWSGSIKL